MRIVNYIALSLSVFFAASSDLIAQSDTVATLQDVIITSPRSTKSFVSVTPVQALGRKTLQQLNAPTVGDAARFFSGVLVKDYGGAGGLKTISVRSLGASNTLILYDGLPVADAQSGQVDLSRFSNSFLQSVELYQANQPGILLPARSYAASSVLAMNTQQINSAAPKKVLWQGGIRSGSFGFVQPFAGLNYKTRRNLSIAVNAELLSSKGNYPFTIENGNLIEKTKRTNAAISALTGEINLQKTFRDSSLLQLKAWNYSGKRGLPGAIIFFNDRAVQRLWNRDNFVQARYQCRLLPHVSLALATKYSKNYTRYADPDFPNNAGGLDSRYRQEEWYGSASLNISLSQDLSLGVASDIANTRLRANTANFVFPVRISFWESLSLQYADSLWHINASLLWNNFSDRLRLGKAAPGHDKLTPTFAASRRLNSYSPFLFRIFYKEIFRMPTFNDLYYNFIGNTNLRPEFARQYNAGIVYTKSFFGVLRQLNLSADAYLNQIKDKIVAVPGQNLFSWTMLNLGSVIIHGVDVSAVLNGAITPALSWDARINYTWQQAKDRTDRSSAKYGDRIPYTPDHSGSGIFSLGYNQWSGGYSFLFSGKRYLLGDNSAYTQLSGWGTQDIFLSHNLLIHRVNLSLKAELNNLSDARYDVVRYYPMPGRSYKFSLLFNNL